MTHLKDDEIEHIYLDDETLAPKPDSRQVATAVESRAAYKKFGYVLLGILIASTLLTVIRGIELNRFMADFMAVFFITFAAFKFYDIEGFAHAYRKFDILAQRLRPWGYAFPFIEAFLGFWYLLSEAPLNLNLIAMFVTATAAIGAYRELNRKSRFQNTCLGAFIRLPLARVSFIENTVMFVMAFLIMFV